MPKVKPVNINDFDAYLLPNPARYKKMLKIALAFLIPGVVLLIISWIFWDEYTTEITVRSLRRGTYNSHEGWPVWVQTIGFWPALIGGIAILFPLFTNYNTPMLAVSKEGIFVNQQFVRRYLVPWEEIAVFKYDEKEYLNNFSITLTPDGRKNLLKGHSGFTKSILNANVDKDNPFLRLDSDLMDGNVIEVTKAALKYWNPEPEAQS